MVESMSTDIDSFIIFYNLNHINGELMMTLENIKVFDYFQIFIGKMNTVINVKNQFILSIFLISLTEK